MLKGLVRRVLGPLMRRSRISAYQRRLRRGEPAGEYTFAFRPWQPPGSALVDVYVRGSGPGAVSESEAVEWCRSQTLGELRATGYDAQGGVVWRVGDASSSDPAEAAWFAAPGGLPGVIPAHLESALLTAAAEEVDAVVLRERVTPPLAAAVPSAEAVVGPELRSHAIYSSAAYAYDPLNDAVRATRERQLVKLIDTAGASDTPRDAATFNRHRRGPYLTSFDPGPRLEVGVRDASLLGRAPRPHDMPAVLVTNCFLARGGAEHTLFETMRVLSGRFDFAIATLAPHRAELGDRRDDFRTISERLYCLGDLVHPAAMLGMIEALLDALGAAIIYNANGTTLFYDFAARLKERRPGLRIVDHLYDHRVGYIDRYDQGLLDAVDACVAENRRIADVLVNERGWPAARVPVIWPCGRPRSELPEPSQRPEIRARVRRELGIPEHDLIFLTAARMHPQKRPLDLVELATRVVDLDTVHFVMVGGGDIEDEVDRSISATRRGRIRRLPFRTDIPDLIVASDVGCLVSDYEGLPVFMLECLQLGRPFLGTDVGDIGEVLRSSGAGLVVDTPGDVDALEACVRRLADTDEWAAMAERAVEVGVRFDPERCAERYAAAFVGDPVPPEGEGGA